MDRTPEHHLTAAGLIAELQRQIETDPDRADHPVEIIIPGRVQRLRVVVSMSLGNPPNAVVGLLARRV